ncbi:MAG: sodium:calcium antiporter [Deltaproteobacteria bacterium]|nr:sodium:calcium antiporter [Deltaproteobacteria bacterium]
MTIDIALLFFYLVVIVAAAEIFTNAVEILGARLGFSEGVTGSIFAAVGTAMPETMVPLVAIFAGGTAKVSEEVGVGAILGAPFMLSTLAVFLIGASAFHWRKRRNKTEVAPERGGLRRDLEFFLFSFSLAFLTAFTPHGYRAVRVFVAFVLVLTYFYYVMETIKASAGLVDEGHVTEESKPLYLSLILKEHLVWALVQLLFAVGLIIIGAKGFVTSVEGLAAMLHVPVMALSLLVVPIATELPEKINSILWIRGNKDTMATGNITGAMVFQGSLLPAIGIFLTPWTINLTVMTSSVITILAALWLYVLSVKAKRLSPGFFVVNGCLWAAFVAIVLLSEFSR